MFSYRTILKQALNLSWKNKYLWLFGLFASLTIAGGAVEYQFINQSIQHGTLTSSFQGLLDILSIAGVFQFIFLGLEDLFHQDFATIVNVLSLFLLTFSLLAAFVWLAITSQSTIVDSVKKIISNDKKSLKIPSLRESLAIGSKHFWPVLALNILIYLAISTSFFIISLPLLLMMIGNSTFLIIAYTVLFIIFIPISLSLSLIVKYAISYRVLENESLVKSLEKGCRLFKNNWLISLEVALILFFINLGVSVLLFFAISLIFFPLFVLSVLFSWSWLFYLTIILTAILIIIFGSFFTTFQISSWTNLYLSLRANEGSARLEKIIRNISKSFSKSIRSVEKFLRKK